MNKPSCSSPGPFTLLLVLFLPPFFLTLAVLPVEAELEKMSANSLRSVEAREGLNIDVDLDLTADYLEFADNNGHDVGNGSEIPGSLRLGNLTIGDGATLTGTTLDVNDAGHLELGMPSGNFFAAVGDVIVPATPEQPPITNGPTALRLSMQEVNVSNTTLELSGGGGGLNVAGDLGIQIGALNLEDGDGADAGGRGVLLFEGIEFGPESGSSMSFDNLTIDADDFSGLNIVMPPDDFTLSIDTICTEIAQDWASCGTYDPILQNVGIDNANFEGSVFELDGAGQGLEIGDELKFSIDEIHLGDPTGTPDNPGATGTAQIEGIRFTDASDGVGYGGGGDPDLFSSPGQASVQVDGDGGLVVEFPGFYTGLASVDDPNNELYIHNMNVGGSCSGNRCGDWSLRNIDPGGSWVKVSGH